MPAESSMGSLEQANFRRQQSTIEQNATADGSEKQLFPLEQNNLDNQEQTIDHATAWQNKLHDVLASDADKAQNLNRSEEQVLLDYQQEAAQHLGKLAAFSQSEAYPQLERANDLLKQIAQLKVKEMFADNRVKNARNTIFDLNDLLQQLNLSPLTAETKNSHSQQLASLIEQFSLKVNELKNHANVYQQQEMTLFSQLESLRPQLTQAGFKIEGNEITPFDNQTENSPADQGVPATNQAEQNQEETIPQESTANQETGPATTNQETMPTTDEIILPNQTINEVVQSEAEEKQADEQPATKAEQLNHSQEQLLANLHQLEQSVAEQLAQAQEQYTQPINFERAKQIIDYKRQLKRVDIMGTYLDSLIDLAKSSYPQLKRDLLSQLEPQADNSEINALLNSIKLYSQQEDITPTELRNVKFDLQRRSDEIAHLLALSEKLQEQSESSENIPELSKQIGDEKAVLEEEKAASEQTAQKLQAAREMLGRSESQPPSDEADASWLKKAREFLLINPLSSLRRFFSGETNSNESVIEQKTANKGEAASSLLGELPLKREDFAEGNQEFVERFNQEIAQVLADCHFWLENLSKGEVFARRQWSEQMMADRQELRRSLNPNQEQESQYYADVPHYDKRHKNLVEKFTQIQHDYARLSRLQRELDYWQNRQNEANDFKNNLNEFFATVNQWQLPAESDKLKFASILNHNYLLLASGFSQADIDKKVAQIKADLEWQKQDLLKNEQQLAKYEDNANDHQYLPALQKYDWQNRENQFKYEQNLNSWKSKNVRERLLAERSAGRLPELQLVRSRENSYWQAQELLLSLQHLDWQLANAREFLGNEQINQLKEAEGNSDQQLLIDKARTKFVQVSEQVAQLEQEKQALLQRLDQEMTHLSQLHEQTQQQGATWREELATLLADYQKLDYAQLLTKREQDRQQVPTLGRPIDGQAA